MKHFVPWLLALGPALAVERMVCYEEPGENVVLPPPHQVRRYLTISLIHPPHTQTNNYQKTNATTAVPYAPTGAAYAHLTSTGATHKTRVIPVVRDGLTCPKYTEPAAEHGRECMFGAHTGSVPNGVSGKCCFHSGQHVFLYSVFDNSGASPSDTEYILDGRPCCTDDTWGTAVTEYSHHNGSRQCQYGKHVLEVPSAEYLTSCCWDANASQFKVHLRGFEPVVTTPVAKEVSKQVLEWGPFRETVGLEVYEVRLFGYYLEVRGKLWASGVVDWSEQDTFYLPLERRWKVAKSWTPGAPATGHVGIDATSRLTEDRSVEVMLHVTGSGAVLGNLDGMVGPLVVDDAKIKHALAWTPKSC